MAFRHGKSAAIFFNIYDVSSYLNEASSSAKIETAETTAFGNSAKTYIVGLQDATVSFKGMWEGSATGSDAIFSGVVGTSADNVVTVMQEGATVGNRATVTSGKLTSYETSAPVGDVVSASAEVQANNGAYNGLVLAAASVNATGNATAQDMYPNAATTNGGVGTLHVTANTRNGAITFKVQHSTDNSTWVDLLTFTAVSTSSTTSERIEVTGTVNRYVRAYYTVAGSTGAATAYMAFARK